MLGNGQCKCPTYRHGGEPVSCNTSLESQMALGLGPAQTPPYCGASLCVPGSQPPCYFTVTSVLQNAGSQTCPKWCRNLQEKSGPALCGCALSISRLTFQKCQPNSHTQTAASVVEPVIFGLVTTASVNSFSALIHLPILSQTIPAPRSFYLQCSSCSACR